MMTVKQSPITVAVLSIAFVLTGVAWMLLPTLQSSGRKAGQSAAEAVERARRMVNKFETALVRKDLVLERLASTGVDPQKADYGALVEKKGKKFEKEFETRWSAFQPMDWTADDPEPAPVDGQIAGLMEEGVRASSEESNQNGALLADALAIVDAVLANPGSAGYVEAHRLKGIIHYYQGVSHAMDARNKRLLADVYRREIARIATEVAGLVALRGIATGSGTDEHIAKTEATVVESQAQLQKVRSQLIELDGKIQKSEARLAEADAKAQSALKSLNTLRLAGSPFADPQGAAEYEGRMMELDAAYRAAAREVQSLQYGRLVDAALSPPGEYISGRYVATSGGAKPGLESGLNILRAQRDALAATQRIWEAALGNLQGNLHRQKGLTESLLAQQQSAESSLTALSKEATNVYDELARLDAEAETAEDTALDMFSKAARAGKAANDSLRTLLSESRNVSEPLSPEAKERSAANAAGQDGWMTGHISGEIVDARLARARVYQSRYAARQQNSKLLAAVQQGLELKEVDAAREQKMADEARAAGITEITEAAAILESAHREAGRHWTFVAQSGNLSDLLVLFGDSAAAKDSLESYRSAVKGRETQPFVRPLNARISRLESASK